MVVHGLVTGRCAATDQPPHGLCPDADRLPREWYPDADRPPREWYPNADRPPRGCCPGADRPLHGVRGALAPRGARGAALNWSSRRKAAAVVGTVLARLRAIGWRVRRLGAVASGVVRGPGAAVGGAVGSVTAELAAAIPVVVLLLTAGLTALGATTTQLRCVDAARETARAAARGDADPVSVGRRLAPAGASIRVEATEDLVTVTVSAPAVGPLWPGRIDATAVVEPEPPVGG
ncbi:TadE family type IV pilus minor pilin [Cryptosporangium phraense]|uniref:Pilus assembly protein n=1 Tax=Cryptosporangium phraense TaxID=2593070 RepID=A0A545AR99_9ACTN|nr:hypothetical protein FL583_17650 [Cryptosporangium phraense]